MNLSISMSGIPLLVRQRSRGGAAGGSMSGPTRGRRNSVAGGPRRQLSRRVSRRDSRRGTKNRRRSSVHPPIHMPKEGEAEEEKEEKEKVPTMRRLSRLLSNAGPALVRRVSKLRRKSLAREYPKTLFNFVSVEADGLYCASVSSALASVQFWLD
ncbi:uncharacterized protein LOC126996581 isoform X2 [Eriocheir sinensis]|uniref:uncharacterized protein LOC126996581 isoform X2 n=1 Tax=Eriocheir sinensis TaxID=95602 RepID=UPI0021C6F8EB|nr:uncharacterized protein LOC126996581 isoform X2 [Eriocheir sinensis]